MSLTLSARVSSWLLRYYLGPDHPFKLRLWGYLMAALGHPRFTVPYFGGFITLDLRDWIQNHVLVEGSFDSDVWEEINRVATENEVLWDVGAHIGTLALRALPDPRFRVVHAFEPHPRTYQALALNVGLNRPIGRAHSVALSDESGPKELFEGLAANTGLASFKSRWGTRAVSVDCKTADEMVFVHGLEKPTILKIDTEGFERHVLQGAARLLRESPPKLIVFEAEDKGGTLVDQELASLLDAAGYVYQPTLNGAPSAEVAARNWIATRRL